MVTSWFTINDELSCLVYLGHIILDISHILKSRVHLIEYRNTFSNCKVNPKEIRNFFFLFFSSKLSFIFFLLYLLFNYFLPLLIHLLESLFFDSLLSILFFYSLFLLLLPLFLLLIFSTFYGDSLIHSTDHTKQICSKFLVQELISCLLPT